MGRQNSVARYHKNTHQPQLERRPSRIDQYSNNGHLYRNDQYSYGDQYSYDQRPTTGRQPSLDALYTRSPQQSMAQQSSMYRGQMRRQYSVDNQSSLNVQTFSEAHNSESPHSYELHTPTSLLSTMPLKPRNALPYPLPALRSYKDFNDPIYMYQILVTRSNIIKRLRHAATSDADDRGYFGDTGLTGIETIDKEFSSEHYTLFFTENLVEPIIRTSSKIHASTFGILGQGREDGQWKVRCWVQPSAQIGKEIQKMVKEELLAIGKVVEKTDRSGSGSGFDVRMSIQEHESFWNYIYNWDSEMRARWKDRFQ